MQATANRRATLPAAIAARIAMSFDYIIIGAGSAGCVIANRLSADPQVSVLLLEAGPKDNNPMIHMPGGCAKVLQSDTLNWQLWSTPQKQLNNRRLWIPRGRTLGGSSSANGMVYIRGHASDYDDWAAAGNDGWGFKEVLPLFKGFEDQVRGADDYHGAGGELYVADAPSDNPLFDRFIDAGVELGIPANNDFNGAEQEGIGRFQVTIKNGVRWSAATAFLKPVVKRPNLTVLTGANVTRLLLQGEHVTGVEYQGRKGLESVSARREVILSAGAVKNPQILQLSGIGHPDDLASVGIQVRHTLPGVGRNLQEHLDLLLRYECVEPITLNGAMRPDRQLKAGLQYILFKKGVAACNNIEGGAFVKSEPGLSRPDIQLHFVPANMQGLTDPLPKQHGITLHACNLRPESRGSVTLASSNPLDAPLIDFNFLDSDADWQQMFKALKLSQELMAARAWDGLIGRPLLPDSICRDEDSMRAAIAACSETVYHPVGTCKMGADEMAVVDSQLSVHGIQGLRIADASIMPTLIGGNTNAPAMMIGEKCAQLIQASSDSAAA